MKYTLRLSIFILVATFIFTGIQVQGYSTCQKTVKKLKNKKNKQGKLTSPNEVFKLAPELILKIGARHPRFAATLANMNLFGLSSGTHIIHWTPVEINTENVSAFLNKDAHQDFFIGLDKKSKQINNSIINDEIKEIIYTVTISGSQKKSTRIIKLKVNQGYNKDPEYSFLEISVPLNKPGSKEKLKPQWSIQ